MIRFLIALFILLGYHLSAQSKLFIGKQKFPSDLIFEIKGNVVYRVNNPASKSEYLFIDNDKVYFRDRKSFTDIKYTIGIDKIYRGSSSSTFDVLFTLKEGKLYIGDTNFSSDCLYTLSEGIIYKGDSTSAFDAIMTYEISSSKELILIAMLILPY